MSQKVIDYLKKKSNLSETLQAASEKVERMDRRAREREEAQASGEKSSKRRRLPKNFLDSFRDDLDAKRNNLKSDQPSDQVSSQVSNQVSNHLIDQMSKQVSSQPNERSSNQTFDQPTDQTFDQPIDQVQYVVGSNTFNLNMMDRPIDLTKRQFATLHYIYFNRPFKVSGTEGISNIMQMGHPNARNQIKSLVKKGYIYKPYRVNIGATGYSTCRVNGDKCVEVLGQTGIANPPMKPGKSDQPIDQSNSQPIDQSNSQATDQPSSSYSSSSLFKKTTTMAKKIDSKNIKKELDHPAMAKWVEWGLRTEQIVKWLNVAPEVTLDDILFSLRHTEFQFIDQGYLKERENKGNPIRDLLSWFWATFKERGFFIPEPNGYVSWERKRIDRIKTARDKLTQEREQLLCLELESELERILGQPESDEFNQVYDHMASIMKKKYVRPESRNTETFRISMMNALKKLKGCENLDSQG